MAGGLKGIGDVWQRIGLIQRVLLLGLLLGCLGAGALVVNWARKPNMCLLYSNLAPSEAARIVEKVRDSSTAYELRDGGAAVYVPEEKVYTLRLAMAQQGLPTGEQAGYRILDEEKIGASPFAQHVNYNRALEGELAKTIRVLEGVLSARVHVVRPERTVFAKQDKDASATVVLQIKSGWRFTSTNTAAIVNLVAGAVEGLSPDRVVVVDSQGNVLAGDGQNNEMAKGAGTFLDYKNRIEQYLAHKAEDMLEASLGPNRASVRVDVVLETNSLNQTKESYDPTNRVVTKERIVSNSTPGLNPAAAGGKEETTESTYMAGKTVEQKVTLPGTVKSISVAAMVDLTTPIAKPGEDKPSAPTLTVKDAEDIIRNAIGMTTGDTNLKVVNAPFHQAPQTAEAKTADAGFMNRDFFLEMGKHLSLGVMVIGVLLALKIFGGKKAAADGAVQSILATQVGGGAAALPAMAEGGDVDADQVRARITRALQENPEEVKRLFLSWVESDKEEV